MRILINMQYLATVMQYQFVFVLLCVGIMHKLEEKAWWILPCDLWHRRPISSHLLLYSQVIQLVLCTSYQDGTSASREPYQGIQTRRHHSKRSLQSLMSDAHSSAVTCMFSWGSLASCVMGGTSLSTETWLTSNITIVSRSCDISCATRRSYS